jgi:hypothetical protein
MRHENKEGGDTLKAPCLFSFFRLGYAASCPDALSSRPHLSLFSTPASWGMVLQHVMYFHFVSGKARGKVSYPGVVHSVLLAYFETFRLLCFWYSQTF